MTKAIKSDSEIKEEMDHKDIVIEYFKLVSSGRFKDGLRFFAPECKTHNPYVSGSMETLTDAMISASKDLGAQNTDAEFAVKHVLADGALVAVHTELLNSKSNPSEGGLRQV
ncbi:MAG: nuclear transport factor 2 family protein, partial [Candidatus Thorarchaeota archaeon]